MTENGVQVVGAKGRPGNSMVIPEVDLTLGLKPWPGKGVDSVSVTLRLS